MKEKTFIIEHLEKEMWPWCVIEYENSEKLIHPHRLVVSNVKEGNFDFGINSKIERNSVGKMDLDWSKVCVLDPKAEKILEPEDGNKFDCFVFGGILGDAEFNGRTGDELSNKLPKGFEIRNLGDKQFSTDNALFVTKMILDGKKFREIKMQQGAEVNISDGEDVLLPYCYPLVNGRPQISSKLITYLKEKKDF